MRQTTARYKPLRTSQAQSPLVQEALRRVPEELPRAARVCRALDAGRPLLFIDVCAGETASLARALRAEGWAVWTFDTASGGAAQDITVPDVLKVLLGRIDRERPDAGHLAPPCSTFSTWMRYCSWASRTRARP